MERFPKQRHPQDPPVQHAKNLVRCWHQKHNIITACSVHISSKPPTYPSESCPACIVGVRRGNPEWELLYCFDELWTLEWQLRGNVIIRKTQKAIQAGDCSPRWRSWPRFPLLAPTRDSFESGASVLVFRTEDVWRRCNQFIETAEFLIGVSPSHSYNAGRAGLGWMSGWF